ncbi:SGNH/GDSL hydrolase family protein [Sphingobium amiense]|uniref:SGNH/GDSL hydrolase family protein n=1 Tax=Sphingobium amiense TaxID=135719 RepID=A0A494W591_9SPHN|nr:SGNH/GDSL hydrolase family protein [Sphingobium amiense]BBD99734.1 SGNH/GDSL hydrolase family protein [Sphingobium amiense]
MTDMIARGMAAAASRAALSFAAVPQIACLGDSNSFINWGSSPSTGTAQISPPTQGILQCRGYAFWAQTLCDARVEFPQALNFGVSGETSTQILARVDQAAAASADAVVVLAGTNDFGAADLPYAATVANLTAIVAALRVRNKRVLLLTVPPRGHPSSHYFSGATDPKLLRLFAVNNWIKRVASQMRGVSVIDPWGEIADPASLYGDFRSGMVNSGDVAHFISASSYQIGKLLAAEFSRLYAPIDWLPKSNSDLFDATSNPVGALNSNAMMLGTGGTLSGTTPTPTGQVADGWTLSGADAGLTLAASKQASGNTTWQRLVLGGTPGAGSDRIVTVSQAISQASGRIVAGDVLEGFARVSVGPSSGLYGIALMIQQTYNPGSGNVTVQTNCGNSGQGADNFMPAEAWSGVLRLPPLTIPTGTLSSLQFRLRVWAQQNTAVSATVDATAMALRKLRAV